MKFRLEVRNYPWGADGNFDLHSDSFEGLLTTAQALHEIGEDPIRLALQMPQTSSFTVYQIDLRLPIWEA